jgi:thioredoxin 1
MIEISSDTFESELQSSSVVVVEIWGPRCRNCLALRPQVEELAERYVRQAKLVKLDSPKYRDFCLGLKVLSLPTFLFYKDGKEIERLTGNSLSIDAVEATLRKSVYRGKN